MYSELIIKDGFEEEVTPLTVDYDIVINVQYIL